MLSLNSSTGTALMLAATALNNMDANVLRSTLGMSKTAMVAELTATLNKYVDTYGIDDAATRLDYALTEFRIRNRI